MDEAHEGGQRLFAAQGDAPEARKPVEEAFDLVAFLVEPPVDQPVVYWGGASMGGKRESATYAVIVLIVCLIILLDLFSRALSGGLSLAYFLGSVALAILVIGGPLILPRWRRRAGTWWEQRRARRSPRRDADR